MTTRRSFSYLIIADSRGGDARGLAAAGRRCRCQQRVRGGSRQRPVAAMQHRRTLRRRMLLGNSPREYLHFLHRLLVAFALGGRDAVTIRGKRLVETAFGRKRLSEQLPRGRIAG